MNRPARPRWSDLARVWDYLLAGRGERLERLAAREGKFTPAPRPATLRLERLEDWAVAGSLLDVAPAAGSLFSGPFALTGLFPQAGVGRATVAVAPPTATPIPGTLPPTVTPRADASVPAAPPVERRAQSESESASSTVEDVAPRLPFAFMDAAPVVVFAPLLATSALPVVAEDLPPSMPARTVGTNTPADPLPAPTDDPFLRAGPMASGPNAAAATAAKRYWSEAGVTDNKVAFEPNVGQAGTGGTPFLARGRGYAVHLAADGATFVVASPSASPNGRGEETAIAQHAVRMTLVGANPAATAEADELQTGRANYYLGADSFPDVARYGRVRFADVYDGVDAVYRRSAEGTLEYDFEVAPGKSADAVTLRVDGADGWSVAADGSLRIRTSVGELVQRTPVAYQETAGGRVPVAAAFAPRADGTLGLSVGEYDRSQPLVVDPVVEFAAIVSGAGADTGLDVAVDSGGNVLLTGWTVSPNLPKQLGELPYGGGADAYVAKVSPEGVILFTTYLGGAGTDVGLGVATDPLGNVYVMGVTDSGAGPG